MTVEFVALGSFAAGVMVAWVFLNRRIMLPFLSLQRACMATLKALRREREEHVSTRAQLALTRRMLDLQLRTGAAPATAKVEIPGTGRPIARPSDEGWGF